MSGRLRGSLFLAVVSASLLSTESSAAVSKIQVLYLVQDGVVTTYDVNAWNGKASKVGALTIQSAQSVTGIAPAPADRYSYVTWLDGNNKQWLSVYATSAKGALLAPAVQTLSATNFQNFAVDPNGCFAYALVGWINGQRQYTAQIELFSVNANSGKLTKAKNNEAQYGPSSYGNAALDGFTAKGDKLFDIWGSTTGNSYAYAYNSHAVDAKTGHLGSDVPVFKISGVSGDVNSVSLGGKLIAQNYIAAGDSNQSWINVFSNPVSKDGRPLIICTSKMLDLCGNANTLSSLLDPAQKNLFLTPGWNNSQQATSVARINLNAKTLQLTGSTIPGQYAVNFSPDGSLVYGAEWSMGTSTIQVYRFNAVAGILTQGGQINVQASFLYSAIRQ